MCPILVEIRSVSVSSEIKCRKKKKERKTTPVKYKPFDIAFGQLDAKYLHNLAPAFLADTLVSVYRVCQ